MLCGEKSVQAETTPRLAGTLSPRTPGAYRPWPRHILLHGSYWADQTPLRRWLAQLAQLGNHSPLAKAVPVTAELAGQWSLIYPLFVQYNNNGVIGR
jgi:hypothetical protein